ncbi:MAG: HAMP domain-containing histidine kinase [Clostridiales bacterium]|nr:HAMP domain-containing histidine kinase [Clostridiales bacterium]
METIKKPSFLRMFLIRSVALVLVFLCISFVWIRGAAEKQRIKNFNQLLIELNKLEITMKSIFDQGRTQTEEAKQLIDELQWEINHYRVTNGVYISAYIINTKIAETDVISDINPSLTEEDVIYCYGYGNTSYVFDKTTKLYKLDKDAEFPSDIYGSSYVYYEKDTYMPVTATPYFPADLDWSLRIAYNDHPSAFQLMPYTCIAVSVLAVIIAFLIALIWTYLAYRRERRIWDILEFRESAIEVMARDLKAPVESISANLQTAREGFTLDPEPYYNAIEQNTDSMSRMIDDILGYTQSETGAVTVEPEIVDLHSLVEQSIKDHSLQFNIASLKTDLKSSSTTIETDPKLFKQALDNLFANCVCHADPNSTITIDLTMTCLTISNKTSLEIKNVNDLKKPFVKGENKTGTGLGLSIAENNLRLLGYSLDLSLKDGIFTAKIKF